MNEPYSQRASEVRSQIRYLLYHDYSVMSAFDLGLMDEHDADFGPLYRLLVSKPTKEGIVAALRALEKSPIRTTPAREEAFSKIAEKLMTFDVRFDRASVLAWSEKISRILASLVQDFDNLLRCPDDDEIANFITRIVDVRVSAGTDLRSELDALVAELGHAKRVKNRANRCELMKGEAARRIRRLVNAHYNDTPKEGTA